MFKIFSVNLCLFFSLSLHVMALESNRLGELNAEYQKGSKQGYGVFVKELKLRLQSATDLKEAARLATLIRGYIHGQIIGFDRSKVLTDEDRRTVLQAHATTTAFFTLSPLGTDRYREDTLRYVIKDVYGRYAQELAIVADAVQAALWAGQAGTREHVTNEVFLRWMTGAYQQGGKVDVSEALGNWTYDNQQDARDIINHTLRFFWPEDTTQKHHDFGAYYKDVLALKCEPQQRNALGLPAGTTINVPGNSNQCGFYSIGKPSMRHQDANHGPRQKFTEAFDRAYYDPQLFWMLVAFSKNKDWKQLGKPELEKLKEEPLLNYERILQSNKEMLAYLRKQHKAKQACLVKEFNIIRGLHCFDQTALAAQIKERNGDETTTRLFNQMWSNPTFHSPNPAATSELEKVSWSLEIIISTMKQIILKTNPVGFTTFVKEKLNPELEKTPEYKEMINTQGEHAPLSSRIFDKNVTHNQDLFTIIPRNLKKHVIEAGTILANSILDAGRGQLEINPGTDVNALDAANASLDTIIAYLNDREVNVLCTEAVMAGTPNMQLPNKMGNYYLGKVIHHKAFGHMFTVNHGGASGGHYQVYVTENTPRQAIANALRNPIRSDTQWNLIQSPQHHSQSNVPWGNEQMLQGWLKAYVS